MKYLLMILALILGSFIITSCKKPEPTRAEVAQTHTPAKGLAVAMKKASIKMRRLAKAVENDDWDEMDVWTRELKEGIGFNCVELYMIENNDIPNEFTVLCNKFNTAINKLMLGSKNHDTCNTSLEFNNLVKSCESCHEGFNKDAETVLDFTG
jgi:hypothetical protein